VAYCGEACQKAGWEEHKVVCNKMKVATMELVKAMINMATKKYKNGKRSSQGGDAFDEFEFDTTDEEASGLVVEANPPKSSSMQIQNDSSNFQDVSVSPIPIRQPTGSNQIFRLVRFSGLSREPLDGKVGVIVVKVWQDLELTSVGVFLPLIDEAGQLGGGVLFRVYTSHGDLIHEQEEEVAELFTTGLSRMGELVLDRSVKLEAHRRYFLVINMEGQSCFSGEGGNFLHCLHTEAGGVQVTFETPENEDLEEFLEDVDNDTSTRMGQIPALYLKNPRTKKVVESRDVYELLSESINNLFNSYAIEVL